MPQYRRGVEAIEQAANSGGSGGGFSPFAPVIRWTNPDEKKYILVLTPPDEVGTFDMHEWISVGKGEKANGESFTRYEDFLARTDPFIGEDFDPIHAEFDIAPKTRCMGVAVELEPVVEDVRGRLRPVSFVVKTATYTRKTDDGEREVTQPVIGLLTQSSYLMWSSIASYEASMGPLAELPLEIIRRGSKKNTKYDFIPYSGIPVDLSPVVEYMDGISYLSESLPDIIASMEATDGSDLAQAQVVAEALFNRRLAELADGERYHELIDPLTEIKTFSGMKSRKGTATPQAAQPQAATPAPAPAAPQAEETPVEPEPAPEPAREDKFAALKARVEGRA